MKYSADQIQGYLKLYCKEVLQNLSDDIVWQDTKKLMKDYKRFLTIDPKKYKMKLLKLIEEF